MAIEPVVYASNFGLVSVIPAPIIDREDTTSPIIASSVTVTVEKDNSVNVEIKAKIPATESAIRKEVRRVAEAMKRSGSNLDYVDYNNSPIRLSFKGVGLEKVCSLLAETFSDAKLGALFVEAAAASAKHKVKVDAKAESSSGGVLKFESTAKWEESLGINMRTINPTRANGRF